MSSAFLLLHTLIIHCRYVKDKIALAPNNDSAWNYLRGILTRTGTSLSDLRSFVIPYTTRGDVGSFSKSTLNLEDPPPSEGSQLPAPPALEFLAEIHEEEPKKESIEHAVVVCRSCSILFCMSEQSRLV